MKKGILLINIGTPNEPTPEAVGAYLKEFLNDPLVIEMPAFLRRTLVNRIIVPFRSKKSARRYGKLWTDYGSPLFVYLNILCQKLQHSVGNEYKVYGAMRYGAPSIEETINTIKEDGIKDLIVLPLYPHYARSTTQSTINEVERITAEDTSINVEIIKPFYKEDAFIKSVCKTTYDYDLEHYDHIVFSYHSLPLKQLKVKPNYKVACFETSDLIARELGIQKYNYTTSFQSRMSKNWIGPFTHDILKKLAKEGKKKILVLTPSFVADCLETTIEIGEEYRDYFIKKGGSELVLIPCLNDNDFWVEAIKKLISTSYETSPLLLRKAHKKDTAV